MIFSIFQLYFSKNAGISWTGDKLLHDAVECDDGDDKHDDELDDDDEHHDNISDGLQ